MNKLVALAMSVEDNIEAEIINDSPDSENVSDNVNEIEEQDISQSKLYGTINFIDDRMLASMDKCKLSTRDAMHIVAATANAILNKVQDVFAAATPINLENLVLNRTTLHLMRREYRRRQAKQIIDEFNVSIIVDFILSFIYYFKTVYCRFLKYLSFIGMGNSFQK